MKKLYWLLTLISIYIFQATPKAIAQTTVNLSEISGIKLDASERYETTEDLIKRLKQSKAEKKQNIRNSLTKDKNKLEKPFNYLDTPVNVASTNFTTFPVGFNIGKRNVKAGVLIRGNEDGSKAVDFQSWLLPYDAVIQALKLNVTTLPDGQLEVRSPGIVTRITPEQLRNDSELGLVFSIADLQR